MKVRWTPVQPCHPALMNCALRMHGTKAPELLVETWCRLLPPRVQSAVRAPSVCSSLQAHFSLINLALMAAWQLISNVETVKAVHTTVGKQQRRQTAPFDSHAVASETDCSVEKNGWASDQMRKHGEDEKW